MDARDFDHLTKDLADRLSRRGLAGFLAGFLALRGLTAETAAKKKKKKRKKPCQTISIQKRGKKKKGKKRKPCQIACVPDCADAVCGGDGCGGSCGSCDSGAGQECVAGKCANYKILT